MKSRGRPRLNKPKQVGRWFPQVWRPEYELIVTSSALGYSNVALAEKFKFTKEHISNILNTPQAKALQELLLARYRQAEMASIPQRLEAIAVKTVDRIEALLNDDERFLQSPFAMIDRGMRVMESVGILKHKRDESLGGVNIEKAVILTGDAAKEIKEAFEKSNEVARLYG